MGGLTLANLGGDYLGHALSVTEQAQGPTQQVVARVWVVLLQLAPPSTPIFPQQFLQQGLTILCFMCSQLT